MWVNTSEFTSKYGLIGCNPIIINIATDIVYQCFNFHFVASKANRWSVFKLQFCTDYNGKRRLYYSVLLRSSHQNTCKFNVKQIGEHPRYRASHTWVRIICWEAEAANSKNKACRTGGQYLKPFMLYTLLLRNSRKRNELNNIKQLTRYHCGLFPQMLIPHGQQVTIKRHSARNFTLFGRSHITEIWSSEVPYTLDLTSNLGPNNPGIRSWWPTHTQKKTGAIS